MSVIRTLGVTGVGGAAEVVEASGHVVRTVKADLSDL
jgi:hypothetical protein